MRYFNLLFGYALLLAFAYQVYLTIVDAPRSRRKERMIMEVRSFLLCIAVNYGVKPPEAIREDLLKILALYHRGQTPEEVFAEIVSKSPDPPTNRTAFFYSLFPHRDRRKLPRG